MSLPSLKGWSLFHKDLVRYFLTGDFRTGQQTRITLRKLNYRYLSAHRVHVYMTSLVFPQANAGVLGVQAFIIWFIIWF